MAAAVMMMMMMPLGSEHCSRQETLAITTKKKKKKKKATPMALGTARERTSTQEPNRILVSLSQISSSSFSEAMKSPKMGLTVSLTVSPSLAV